MALVLRKMERKFLCFVFASLLDHDQVQKIFDTLSQTICWIAKHNYDIDVILILHLLDDFLTIDPPSECGERTMALLTHFQQIEGSYSTKQDHWPLYCY